MGILSKIFSSGTSELVKEVGGVIDNLTTTKEEKLQAEQKIKELFRQKSPVQARSTVMIPDSLHFCICDNKIFVEKSTRGFFIDVYNAEGKKLYQIEKKYEKVNVTNSDKE